MGMLVNGRVSADVSPTHEDDDDMTQMYKWFLVGISIEKE
jgi:hypothetical protein